MNKEISKILKKYFIITFSSIYGILLFYTAYFFYNNMTILGYLSIFTFIGNSFLGLIILMMTPKIVKYMISIHYSFMLLSLFPFAVIFWNDGHIAPIILYISIFTGALMFYSIRKVIYLYISIIIIVCIIFFSSGYLPKEYAIDFTTTQINILNIVTLIFCVQKIIINYYYTKKLDLCREKLDRQTNNDGIEQNDTKKYSDLYTKILDYFEKENPFRDPDFSISGLAGSLNTNVKYISKAISMNCDTNFNTFVNTYRINLVKDMLNKGYQDRYTIRYIYTYVGFRYQSTFNKVFKQIEGITPSEYAKHIAIGMK